MKFIRIFTAFVLTVCLAVTTVVCCCVAQAVMAHLHKASMCSHCLPQNSSHSHSPVPGNNCIYQLTNAEAFYGQVISAPAPVFFRHGIFFDKHTTPFLPSLILAYSRGSPQSTASLVPIYLRTFNLRV